MLGSGLGGGGLGNGRSHRGWLRASSMGPRARSSPKFGSQGRAFRMVFQGPSIEALDLGCQGRAETHGFHVWGTGIWYRSPKKGS